MTVLIHLKRWKDTGAITEAQFNVISALVRKERFSVFIELNTLLYLGVLSFVGGVGWTIQSSFASLGDAAILSSLTAIFALSLYYCFSRALPYTHAPAEPSGFAFDYVLYLGCLVFGLELGYLESRFHLLPVNWDHYLLLSSFVFFALAYRFDNRFVLSLALSTLAGWFGLRLSRFGLVSVGSLPLYALAYGGLVAGAGTWLHWIGIKKHFLETYLHGAANVLFVALVSGIGGRDGEALYLLGLLGLGTLAIVQGIRFKRFAFVVYGVVYGYVGISTRLVRDVDSFTAALAYFVISGAIVIVSLVVLARRFGREE